MLASGTLFAWAFAPKIARAEGRDPRLLTIVLRGALDGLAAVAPVGDPDWVGLRGDMALMLAGADARPVACNSFFALNPAMPNLHRLYQSSAATIVPRRRHPYRERSHFDGQDVLRERRAAAGRLGNRLAQPGPGHACARWAPPAAASRDAFAVGPHDPAGGARPRPGTGPGRRRGCRPPTTTP